MLVLSRKQNEEIWIGDDIKICIVNVKGERARIGIEAPQDKKILRGELKKNLETALSGSARDGGEGMAPLVNAE